MGIKSDLINAQTKALKAGNQAKADELGRLITRLKKLRGDATVGIGPGESALFGPSQYTIRKGDSPLSVAKDVFGFADLSTVKLIAEFNPELFKITDDKFRNFEFIGQPGDVLDLSFANAPNLLGGGDKFARYFQKGFGGVVGSGGSGNIAGGPTSFTSGSGAAPSTELRPGIDIPKPPSGGGGSFVGGNPNAPVFNVGGTPSGNQFATEFNAIRSGELEPPGGNQFGLGQTNAVTSGGVPGFGATNIPGSTALGVGEIPTTTPDNLAGGPSVGFFDTAVTNTKINDTLLGASDAFATTPATATSEPVRGTPGRGNISVDGTPDEFTQFSMDFIGSISLFGADPANADVLPVAVPDELARFTAAAYGKSAVQMMSDLGVFSQRQSDGMWIRNPEGLPGATGPPSYYGTYRNGISQSNRYFSYRKGRLQGPFTPRGPGGGGNGGGRSGGFTGGSFPGTVLWSIRFPELS